MHQKRGSDSEVEWLRSAKDRIWEIFKKCQLSSEVTLITSSHAKNIFLVVADKFAAKQTPYMRHLEVMAMEARIMPPSMPSLLCTSRIIKLVRLLLEDDHQGNNQKDGVF